MVDEGGLEALLCSLFPIAHRQRAILCKGAKVTACGPQSVNLGTVPQDRKKVFDIDQEIELNLCYSLFG
jgi:hypothetical protein